MMLSISADGIENLNKNILYVDLESSNESNTITDKLIIPVNDNENKCRDVISCIVENIFTFFCYSFIIVLLVSFIMIMIFISK